LILRIDEQCEFLHNFEMTGCIHPRDINMTFEEPILETLAMMRNIKSADIHIESVSNKFFSQE